MKPDPQARLLDALTPEETLEVIDPSHGKGYPPVSVTPNPKHRAVAAWALAEWRKLRMTKPKPPGYRDLWRAACAAMNGFEAEGIQPRAAVEYFAEANALVVQMRKSPK